MARRLFFDDQQTFLQQLEQLLSDGIPSEQLDVRTPYHLSEVENLLGQPPSKLPLFALGGALAGFGGGFLLAALTSLDWPIITGGKPIVAVPPFLLIGYLMTILIGSLASFGGFLLLARMPRIDALVEEQDFDSRFIITIADEVTPCTTPN
jgi:Alternative complex III, ActD subunit